MPDSPPAPWLRTLDATDCVRAVTGWLRAPGLARRIGPALRAHFAGAPASTAYVFTLLVTWWTLRGLSPQAERALILSASTNLHNMRENPIQVLVASAFWTEGGFPYWVLPQFLVVTAFAERRLGTARWIALFAVGHVGATLLTVTAISYGIDHGVIPYRVAVAADVGSSYGATAIMAAMSFLFRGGLRLVWAGTLVAVLAAAYWIGPTFTDYGHLCAAGIGLVAGAAGSAFQRRRARRAGQPVR
ncbi:rhomboid-like protein [Nocardia asteroides]|uniref:rhomboid-like protein n=1 Tax=Nocardia asteroides TaxID=1824 RepID=UPI001E446762|nr:rhomboid-like protein [Nocardia asteroides]UGT63453.1 hypothetical protein LTT61_09135 [Nocardia asteroides]